MAGQGRRDDLEAQTRVLRAVLQVEERGLTEEEIGQRDGDLDAATIGRAVEALLDSGLLERAGSRLHPSGAASHFSRRTPL